jgi:hypothetical protein
MLQRQAHLQLSGESLQIPYPSDFPEHEKTGGVSDESFFLSAIPKWLSVREIKAAREYIQSLGTRQSLVELESTLLDENDPLLGMNNDQLDQVEEEVGMENTRTAPGGGERQPRERAYLIREWETAQKEPIRGLPQHSLYQ